MTEVYAAGHGESRTDPANRVVDRATPSTHPRTRRRSGVSQSVSQSLTPKLRRDIREAARVAANAANSRDDFVGAKLQTVAIVRRGTGTTPPTMQRLQARALGPALERIQGDDPGLAQLRLDVAADVPVPLTVADSVWSRAGIGVAIDIARDVRPATFGLLTHLLAVTQNVRDSLQRLERHYNVLSDGIVYHLDARPTRPTLLADVRRPFTPEPVTEVFALAAAVGFLRHQCLGFPPIRSVSLRPQFGPVAAKQLRDFFAAPVSLGAKENAVQLGANALETPMRSADASLLEILIAHARSVRPPDRPYAATVLQVLMHRLPHATLEFSAVARELAVSPRTLRRRLAEDGTSFQPLVDEARRSFAERALRADARGISDLALSLGYADASAFRRAFRRWTGITPAAYRQRVAAPTLES